MIKKYYAIKSFMNPFTGMDVCKGKSLYMDSENQETQWQVLLGNITDKKKRKRNVTVRKRSKSSSG